MRQLFADLWQTTPEHPFSGVTSHAYLWLGPGGNILFYSSSQHCDYAQIARLGGISYQCLSHRDEASAALLELRQQFVSQLCCHRLEVAAVEQCCPVDYQFQGDEHYPEGVEVLHTPGHTDGSCCFLCQSVTGRQYLFSGDTLFAGEAGWDTFVLETEGGSRSDLQRSLQRLRGLSPDVVLSSASVTEAYRELTAGEWGAQLDELLDDLSIRRR